MKRATRRYSGSEFKRRDPSQTSIERSAAEAARQAELRARYGWYGAMQHMRLEREAKANAEGQEGHND